jgi:CspA family cold shock protein
MPVCTVQWFNPRKGFGFIVPDDGAADVFVHLSAVEQAGLVTLDAGQKVSFDLQPTSQGKVAAVNIRLA